jgi:TIR domain-containing protein
METQKVFFSYSRDDSEFALHLAQDLRSAGANIWIDQLDIPTGKRWDLAIEEALAEANHLVIILSESSVASNNVMDEVSYALEAGKKILPVVIDECRIPFRLKRLQFIDFIDDYDKGLAKLLADLSTQQSSATRASATDEHAGLDEPLTDTRKKKSRIKGREPKRGVLLKFGIAAAVLVIGIVLVILYRSARPSSPFNNNAEALQSIDVWKVGSPHEGDTPDSTPPFDLQKAAKKMGFKLNVEGFPAKGFAAKFFAALEKHEEPDILVIDNYGIIEGITTALGNFTGIGSSKAVRDSLILATGSLKEFESGQGGWEFLIATSRNHLEAKALALRQPYCDPELTGTLDNIKKVGADELQKYALRSILESDMFRARLGGELGMTICGFWGNRNLGFLNSTVTYDAERAVGWGEALVIMERRDSAWELLSLGGNVDLVASLNQNNKKIALVDEPLGAPFQDKLKVTGPPSGTESTRTSKPSLTWEWDGDVRSIACYLLEAQFDSGNEWSESNFEVILPERNVEMVAPFGVGAQPHRWRVWTIDRKGAVGRSSWSTINYTD